MLARAAREWLTATGRRAQAVEWLVTAARRAQNVALYIEPILHAALEPGGRQVEDWTVRSRARPSVHWPLWAVYSALLRDIQRTGLVPSATRRAFVSIMMEDGGFPQRQQASQTPRSRLRLLLRHKSMYLTRHPGRDTQPCRRPSGGVPWGLTVYSRYLHLQQPRSMARVAATMP